MSGGSYSLDPAELTGVIEDLVLCRRTMEARVVDLRRQLEKLHQTWDGLAAEAHVVAQAVIEDGLAAMDLALDDFTATSASARAGYQVAWDANVALWRSVL
ncbi:WXG100 family type VII secretion target [Nocardioides sp. LML1-1-1.1]|uniref:WXG100 family type VII secretion target n=1 Tax=Nocardioides sp. LML1-1-1.1 TaxID=3135248 RepID=UPI00341C00B8